MYPRKLTEIFTKSDLREFARFLSRYFKCSQTRIYEVFLQLDSIDDTIHALIMTKETGLSLNEIIYQILYYRDNKDV